MNFLKNKKTAFTLMEISITILIIGILIMLYIPILKGQLKKTDEYSYYLAYKTVEKLGSQIVAYGDPALVSENNTNKFNSVKILKNRLVNKFSELFMQKSYADTPELISWTSYQYNVARVCLGASNVVKSDDNGSIVYWTNSDPEISSQCKDLNFYYHLFTNPSVCSISESNFKNSLLNTSDSQTFCQYLSNNCSPKNNIKISKLYKSVSSAYSDDISSYNECIIYQKEHELSGSSVETDNVSNRSVSHADCAINSWRHSSCKCTNPAKNNSHYCCSSPDMYVAFENGSYSCKSAIGEFNESTNSFCPEHSKYSYSDRKCVCEDGYTLDEDGESCNNSDCQKGTTYDEASNSCVSNPPITSAKRFCELISENWNTSEVHCDTFTEDNGISYYEDVFDAVNYLSEDGNRYLSINSLNKNLNKTMKETYNKQMLNAFKSITPNIVFSNGLRMWILGDKSASIAGLSYDPTAYEKDENICKDTGVHSASSCSGDNSYFCKSENRCFTLKSGTSSLKLKDARNCCRTLDVTDLIDLYYARGYRRDPRDYAINGFTVFVDINGAKDDNDPYGGTLWYDVFPFYVSANGRVYPGYPLDADKDSSKLYLGGNSTSLATDVYYYKNTDKGRKRIIAYPSVSYARAMCLTRDVSAYTPYCQNLGHFKEYEKFKKEHAGTNTDIDQFFYSTDNKCVSNRCFIHLKNKFKFL